MPGPLVLGPLLPSLAWPTHVCPSHMPHSSLRAPHTPPSPGPPLPPTLCPGRRHTVLLSIVFGGLALVALVTLVYVLLRRRKSNT